jgi:ABC-type glycerol-3-phosphate transport system substrate-binding protein
MLTKKIFALLLSLLFAVGLFAGCSSDQAEASASPSAAAPSASAAPASAAPSEDPGITFPLADPVTFEIWNGPMSATAGMTTPNDSFAYQEAEKP